MPCLSPEAQEQLAQSDKIHRLTKSENQLTDMLCRIGRNYFMGKDLPEDVVKWMEEHCEYDKERGEPWEIEPTKSGAYMSISIISAKIEGIIKELNEERIKVQWCFDNNQALLSQLIELQKELSALK